MLFCAFAEYSQAKSKQIKMQTISIKLCFWTNFFEEKWIAMYVKALPQDKWLVSFVRCTVFVIMFDCKKRHTMCYKQKNK